VVKNVLMTDCQQGQASLVQKARRRDLVQAFVQDDGDVEFIAFPDLPDDVAELLIAGQCLSIVDAADDMKIDCYLETTIQKVLSK